MPTVNAAGISLIKQFEGLRLRSYDDATGQELSEGDDPQGVVTIGYGHTRGVCPGLTCTEAQADQWLADDTHAAAEEVQSLCEVELTPNQFAALVSFEFNTGALGGSTLMAYVNKKQFAKAAAEFPRWVYGSDLTIPVPGLIVRREAEQKLFETPG